MKVCMGNEIEKDCQMKLEMDGRWGRHFAGGGIAEADCGRYLSVLRLQANATVGYLRSCRANGTLRPELDGLFMMNWDYITPAVLSGRGQVRGAGSDSSIARGGGGQLAGGV